MRRNVRYVRNVSNQLAVSLGYFIRSLLLAAEMGAMGGDMGYIVRIVFILGFLGCIMGQTDPCGRNGPMVMQGYTGTISSPNYPQTYPTYQECSQTPPDIIVTTKERITVNFQPPMEAPGKGFALHWETSCQENYFSCPEGFCLRPEKVCDGNDDCQQGEDESYSTCPVSTTSSTSSPLDSYPRHLCYSCHDDGACASPVNSSLPVTECFDDQDCWVTEVSLNGNVLNGTFTFCGSQTPPDIIVTTKERITVNFQPPMEAPGKGFALHWETSCQENYFSCPEGFCLRPEKVCDGNDDCQQGEDESYSTCPVSTTSSTSSPLDSYPRHLCYSCHDDGACASPVNSSLPVTECFDDQDCWVERILGPGKGKERIVYRRGCGSLCPDHWKQEDCTDGWLEVCLLCCSEDLCNSQLLSGDDKRFSNQVWEGSSVVGVLEPNWIYFLAASLSAVSMFTA
uniref:CUB domain-containing protein n=1 Tax=Branchiostoma floridae TaxID=7739 RepID=C3YJ48_BRAFL|eukprot:XP_002603699.1 hypothetical protein BRAFLDRAFT_93094 [Branchiostoma floridae]